MIINDEEEDKSLSPVLFTPHLTRIRTNNERLFYSRDISIINNGCGSLKSKRKNDDRNSLWTPYSEFKSFSQVTPQSSIRKRCGKRPKSTLKKSLDALLDPDVCLSWTLDMATPPKSSEPSKPGEENYEFKENVENDQKKNHVARVLFQVPNIKTKLESFGYLPLDDSVSDFTSGKKNHNDNMLQSSSVFFETSEIPSCINSFEMSPPVTAKKRKNKDIHFRHQEHSLGVSLLESPWTNKKRRNTSNSSSLEGQEDVVDSPPIFSTVHSVNLYQPKSLKYQAMKFDNLTVEVDENMNELDDECFLSPPITLNETNKNILLVLPSDISQSTPIVNSRHPCKRMSFNAPFISELNMPLSTSKNMEDNIDADIRDDTALLANEELSPSVTKVGINEKDCDDLSGEIINSLDNLSPSVTHLTTQIHSSNCIDKSSPGKACMIGKTKMPNKSINDSTINVSDIPFQFDLDLKERNKNFFYPNTDRKNDKSECLESISVVKMTTIDPKRSNETNFSIVNSNKSNSLEDILLPLVEDSKLHRYHLENKDHKLQSSFINMDDLSQLPLDLIKSISPRPATYQANDKQEDIFEINSTKRTGDENEIDNQVLLENSGGFETANKTNADISENANHNFVPDDKPNFFSNGFQTAKGTKVNISEDALKAAKQKFANDNITSDVKPSQTFVGFQTAKGTKVNISEDALKAAKLKFANDIVTPDNKSSQSFVGFQTAKGSKVNISEDALKAAKQKFANDNITPDVKPSQSFVGFQTAKGAKVNISEDALKTAKQKIDEISIDGQNLGFATDCNASTGKLKMNKHVPFEKNTIKAKRKIKYTTPESFQFDRDVAFSKSLRSTPEPFRTQNTTGNKNIASPVCVEKSKTPFTTPFKKSKRPVPKQYEESLAEKDLPKNKKRALFSYKPFVINDQICGEADKSKRNCKTLFIQDDQSGIHFSKKKGKTFSEQVNYCAPEFYSHKELIEYGLKDDIITINGQNAQNYQFEAKNYFSSSEIDAKQVFCCGIVVKMKEDFKIGLDEIKEALLNSEEIDESLIPEGGWIENHYRWIVWKLASYERRYPSQFAGRCLTLFNVIEQLKYRYVKELEKAERSCLKKIYERDDVSTGRMVLFVSDILQDESKNGKKIIKLSDGWYEIKATLDQPLSVFFDQGKISIGYKLCIYGAELTGSSSACTPLQAPESLMLMLYTNSTRRASWDAKLGYQIDKRAFLVPLKSLFPDGGVAGCICALVLREYPTQWMEKVDGRCVFRTLQGEEDAKKIYEEKKTNKMEKLYSSVQQKFEENSGNRGMKRKRRSFSFKEIKELKDGSEIYNALESVIDPLEVEASLTPSQKATVFEYKQKMQEIQQEKIMRTFHEEWRKLSEEEFPERCVVQLKRYRICDCTISKKHEVIKDAILTVWRPSRDILEAFKEGAKLKIFNLSASQSRHKHTSCNFQLSTNNTTKYQPINEDGDELQQKNSSVFLRRKVHQIDDLYCQVATPYNEVDIVGIILKISRNTNNPAEVMYVSDGGKHSIAVKFWNGLQAFNIKDKFQENCLVTLTNLSVPKFATPTKNRILQLTYTDFSCISKNPKASYLKQAFQRCQQIMNEKYIQIAKHSLQQSLQQETPILKSQNFNTEHRRNADTPLTSKISNESGTQSSESILPSEKLLSRQKLQMKKRLSLERYREPPPLSPLQKNFDKNLLRSQFKPPSLTKK